MCWCSRLLVVVGCWFLRMAFLYRYLVSVRTSGTPSCTAKYIHLYSRSTLNLAIIQGVWWQF